MVIPLTCKSLLTVTRLTAVLLCTTVQEMTNSSNNAASVSDRYKLRTAWDEEHLALWPDWFLLEITASLQCKMLLHSVPHSGICQRAPLQQNSALCRVTAHVEKEQAQPRKGLVVKTWLKLFLSATNKSSRRGKTWNCLQPVFAVSKQFR